MIWIVAGMHRSGTSLVAGLLHNTGIHFGDDKTFLAADKANTTGYFENTEFKGLNDAILGKYKVKAWNTEIPTPKNAGRYNIKVQNILQRYNEAYENWGAKDPRFCLTWQAWNFDPEHTIFIIPYRNPLEVANSLFKRDKLPIEKGLALWNIYNQRILKTQEYFEVLTVNYNNVLQGTEFPDTKNLTDLTMRHNLAYNIPESCKETWEMLLTKQMPSGKIDQN